MFFFAGLEKENTHPLPPGSFGLPLIGETIDFLRDRNFSQRREQKYGNIFKTNIGKFLSFFKFITKFFIL